MNPKITITAAVFAALLLLCGCRLKQKTGSLRVRVLDGPSDAPICGACVTVPEIGKSFITDAKGLTDSITAPVIPDSEYDKLLPSDEGRLTLIVHAEGCTPYLLLYARIEPGAERRIDVLLFPADGSLPVFTVIEAPDAEWCEKLAEKYGN